MKIPNIAGLVKVGKTFIMTNRPELLFGASVVSTVGAVIMAARGGYQARGIIDDAQMDSDVSLTLKEKISLTWLCYMPAAITTVGAVGATTGLHLVHVKEKKALATAALAAVEEAKTEMKRFESSITEAMTPEEKEKVQNRLFEKQADPDTGVAVMQNTDGVVEEFYLIRDPFSGRDIWSNKTRIEEAIVEVGNMVNGSGDASLNNFYEKAGWGRIDQGDEVGWSGVLPSISWVDTLNRPIVTVRDDGRPVRGFRFQPEPEKDFDDPHR